MADSELCNPSFNKLEKKSLHENGKVTYSRTFGVTSAHIKMETVDESLCKRGYKLQTPIEIRNEYPHRELLVLADSKKALIDV